MFKNLRNNYHYFFYTFPFIFLFLVNIFITNDFYVRSSLSGDTLSGGIGLGLSWLINLPNYPFHHPSYFWTQLTAILLLLSGGTTYNLNIYVVLLYIVNIAYIILSGFIVSFLSKTITFDPTKILLCSIISSAMPTTLGFMCSWPGPYFVYAVVSFPLYLSIWAILVCKPEFQQRILIYLMFLLGFLFGNLTSMFALVISTIIFVFCFFYSEKLKKFNRHIAPIELLYSLLFLEIFVIIKTYFYQVDNVWTLIIIPVTLVIIIFVFSSLELRHDKANTKPFTRHLETITLSILLWIFFKIMMQCNELTSTICALAAFLPWHRFNAFIQLIFYNVVYPLLIGLFCAINVLAKGWMPTFTHSISSKGSAATLTYSIPEFLFHPILLITESPWGFLFFITIFGASAIILFGKRQNKHIIIMVSFSLASMVLCMAQTLNIQFKANLADNYSGSLRYFTPVIGSVCVIIISMVERIPAKLTKYFITCILLICISSVILYFKKIHTSDIIESRLNLYLKSYYTNNKFDSVICLRTESPHGCLKLYSYNNYTRSITKTIVDDKAIFKYIHNPSQLINVESGKYLVIGNLPGNFSSICKDVLLSDNGVNIYECNIK